MSLRRDRRHYSQPTVSYFPEQQTITFYPGENVEPTPENRIVDKATGFNKLQLAEFAQVYYEHYGSETHFTIDDIEMRLGCYHTCLKLYILKKLGIIWFSKLHPIWDIHGQDAITLPTHEQMLKFVESKVDTSDYDMLTAAELERLTCDIPDPGLTPPQRNPNEIGH